MPPIFYTHTHTHISHSTVLQLHVKRKKNKKVPTSVESFAVGEERELEEQSAQQICSTHDARHLVEMEEEEERRSDRIEIKKQASSIK